MFANIKPRTTVVVLAAAVYMTYGVPLLAGSAAKFTTLNVFAIFYTSFIFIYNFYPSAIASAVASSAADAVVASVPAAAGNVNVTSAVDAGPIKVTLFDPLSLSSKN